MLPQIFEAMWGGWAGYVATVAAWVSALLILGCAIGDLSANRGLMVKLARRTYTGANRG